MISAVICVAAILWIPGLVIFAVSAQRAPRGFEDADGFHEIVEPKKARSVYGARGRSPRPLRRKRATRGFVA